MRWKIRPLMLALKVSILALMRRSVMLAAPALAVVALVATRLVPGPLGRAPPLPSGWRIEPAGRQVSVGTLPLNLAVTGDGLVFVTNNGYGDNGLMRIDPVAGTATWVRRMRAAWLGLARAGRRGADTVWASGAGQNSVYRVVRAGLGAAWRTDSMLLGDSTKKVFVAGVSTLRGRPLVAVVGNLSDSVYLIDAKTLERRDAIAVGHRPYTAVADAGHLYVSDWGDSTVSVFDLNAGPPYARTAWFVGPHPSALTLGNGSLFVALAGSNGVARVDLRSGRVIEQLTVALDPRAPVGSDPNALALSPDGRTLYVALAGNNSVAVVRIGPRAMRVAGLIPVGWYPTAVATSGDGRTLYVANGKGGGSGANTDGTYIGNLITGSVSIVPVPDSAALARYTARVYALSPYSNPALRGTTSRPTPKPPIRHVVYVIRENRTYDQVFGDVAKGNGDAGLAIFNDSITPNAHAITQRWVLFDNFYVDGEVSADGHEWTTRAFANDFNEKVWPQIYSDRRDWDVTSGEDLANRAESYLWDAAKRKGLWVVNFGEMTTDEADTIRTNIAGLKGITANRYPGVIMSIPDTVRANLFADSVASWDRQGRFPALVILYLPRDHTVGRRADEPTPRAMVADNDLAMGRVVERLSRSSFWSALALFALEDDAQNGPDHVDAHRSVLLVASPYARRGVVDSTLYTTSSVLGTIGALLGLPPLSQYDAGATPLWSAFAARPDLAPFATVPNRWPLDERNAHAFRSRVPDQDLAGPDLADEEELNAEIWASVRPHERSPAPRTGFLRP